MKATLISILIFALLLTGIFCNGRYLHRVTGDLYDCLRAVPSYADSDENSDSVRATALRRFRTVWEAERLRVSLTVSLHVTEGIDDCLGRLDAALAHREKCEFDASLEHLFRIVEDLCRYDGACMA